MTKLPYSWEDRACLTRAHLIRCVSWCRIRGRASFTFLKITFCSNGSMCCSLLFKIDIWRACLSLEAVSCSFQATRMRNWRAVLEILGFAWEVFGVLIDLWFFKYPVTTSLLRLGSFDILDMDHLIFLKASICFSSLSVKYVQRGIDWVK